MPHESILDFPKACRQVKGQSQSCAMTTLLGMRTGNFTDKSPGTWQLGLRLVVRDRRGDIDLTHERWASFWQQGRGTRRCKGPEGGEKGEKACFQELQAVQRSWSREPRVGWGAGQSDDERRGWVLRIKSYQY